MRLLTFLFTLSSFLCCASEAAAADGSATGADPSASPRRSWIITSHSQLSTNISEDKHSSSMKDPVFGGAGADFYHEYTMGGTTSDKIRRYCSVDRIGLTDGDPVKDADVEEGGGEPGKPWMSPNVGVEETDRNYIEVKLPDGFTLEDDEDLVFYLKRHTLSGEEHPTGLRICAGYEDSDFSFIKEDKTGTLTPANDSFDIVGYAYFLYRGKNTTGTLNDDHILTDGTTGTNGTKEYSSRIDLGNYREHFKKDNPKKYTRLRIYFTANNTKKRIMRPDGTDSDNRTAALLAFNIMKIARGVNYSDILVDRFHLVTDYSYKYYNYDFIPTLGIMDERNNYFESANKNKHLKDYFIPPYKSGSPWKWNESEKSYQWSEDTEYLKLAGIEMPEYYQVNSKRDKRVNGDLVPNTKTENWRQPAHEQEHMIYAIPGDPIALYPYYGMMEGIAGKNDPFNKYSVKFTHWYNYRTGGNSEYLDFLVDPSLMCPSGNYGFYGGMAISRFTKVDPDQVIEIPKEEALVIDISNEADFINFVTDFNSGKYNNKPSNYPANTPYPLVNLKTDLDFSKTDWEPVPIGQDASNPFKGTFDGQGHRISNYIIKNEAANNVGIFNNIGGGGDNEGAIVKNLFIDSSCHLEGKDNVAPIVKYIDNNNDTSIKKNFIKNVVCEATIIAHGSYAGGIISNIVSAYTTIENCVFLGNVTANKYAAIFGFSTQFSQTIKNCYSLGTVNQTEDDNRYTNSKILSTQDWNTIITTNCYFLLPKGGKDIEWRNRGDKNLYRDFILIEKNANDDYIVENTSTTVSSPDFVFILNGNSNSGDWEIKDGESLPSPHKNAEPKEEEEIKDKSNDKDKLKDLDKLYDKIYKTTEKDDQPKQISNSLNNLKLPKYGMVGTFLSPRTTNADLMNGLQEFLSPDPTSPDYVEGTDYSDPDNWKGDLDYLICADLSTIFQDSPDELNLDNTKGNIHEPIVNFRHIFRIKDGRRFAETFSGSPEKNLEYVKNNRRRVQARSKAQEFQIRLENALPVKDGNNFAPPGAYYYKISDTDYNSSLKKYS